MRSPPSSAGRTDYVAGEFNDGAILIVLRCLEFHAIADCNAAWAGGTCPKVDIGPTDSLVPSNLHDHLDYRVDHELWLICLNIVPSLGQVAWLPPALQQLRPPGEGGGSAFAYSPKLSGCDESISTIPATVSE
jgi:hypothetical protein